MASGSKSPSFRRIVYRVMGEKPVQWGLNPHPINLAVIAVNCQLSTLRLRIAYGRLTPTVQAVNYLTFVVRIVEKRQHRWCSV